MMSDFIRVTDYAATLHNAQLTAKRAENSGRDTRLVEIGNALANVQRMIEQERKRSGPQPQPQDNL